MTQTREAEPFWQTVANMHEANGDHLLAGVRRMTEDEAQVALMYLAGAEPESTERALSFAVGRRFERL